MNEAVLNSISEENIEQVDASIENEVKKIDDVSGVESEKTEEPQLDDFDREYAKKTKYSDTEQQAMLKGWRPSDEFSGDPKDFRSAQEFLGRTDLYNKISNQNIVIKRLEDSMQELTGLNRRQNDMLLKEKADYILQQKRLAIENGNVDETERFEKAYHDINQELTPRQTPNEKIQNQPDVHPAALEFARRNANWFNEDSPENSNMKDYAIKKEVYLQRLYPEWTDEKRLNETERSVKDFFSNKFKNSNRDRASKVSVTNEPTTSTRNKFTFNQLPNDLKETVRNMASGTRLSLDDYAQKLHETGEV